MGFFLIKGTFHITGYSPDGDSMRFEATNPDNWKLLSGFNTKLNARGHAQLRLEAIDALETHFEGHHQPVQFAQAATEFLLENLDIANVQWNESHTKVTSADDGTSGFIVSRTVEKNGRPVAFIFAGDADQEDGSDIFMDNNLLKQSINYTILKAGLVYPTYYTGLFHDLREELTQAAQFARQNGIGFWPQDRTNAGFVVNNIGDITERNVILPKLFRRIISYIGQGGSILGFKEFLSTNPDPVLLLASGHFTNLDTVVEINNNSIKLTVPPEELVFMS